MVTEDYVSFDLARLLKEKGFDEKCSHIYRVDGTHLYCGDNKMTETSNSDLDMETLTLKGAGIYKQFECTCPTLQRVMKWLRVVHKLGVFPSTYYREVNACATHDYGSVIVRLDTYEVVGDMGDPNNKDFNFSDYTFAAETYEETAEKAIKYCLKNLI